MTTPDSVTKPQMSPTSAWSMYRSIVGIGTVCAVLIVAVYQITAPRIRDNQEQFLTAAITEILPAAHSTLAVSVADAGGLEKTRQAVELPVFLSFDNAGNLNGAIITAEGMGYQDNIRVLYAYSFEQHAVTGFKVLDSKETPGLGDRVETEPHFLANFYTLDATLDANGDALLHAIVTVKQGEKTKSWQIDGITGATITSVAIGNILNHSARIWVPILERHAPAFALSHRTEEQ